MPKSRLRSGHSQGTEAIELNPQLTTAYNNRGNVYKDMGKNSDRAIQDYDKAIKLNPNLAAAYYNRGIRLHEDEELT